MRLGPPLAALALLTVTLAGCVGDEGATDAAPQADPELAPEAPDFEPADALPMDVASAEPNLALHGDGTVFATAPVGATYKPNAAEGAAWLWRSTDGGDSWTTLRDPHAAEGDGAAPLGAWCSCDADVATSPDGWTYYTDWWIAGLAGPGNYLVEASPDGGDTWNKAPVTIPEPSSVDRQWLVAGEDGFVGLFYSYFGLAPVNAAGSEDTPVGGQAIQAVFSHDHGSTWSTPVRVVPAEEGWGYQIAHPRILPDGTIAMPYGAVHTAQAGEDEDFFTAPSEVRVAVSHDDGNSWEQVTVAQAPEGFDNLWAVQGDVDDAGHLHVAWAARDDDTVAVHAASSRPDLDAWSDPVEVRSTGINVLPWVAARGEGRLAVGWYGGNATGDPVEAPDDAEWFAYVAERGGPNASWATGRVDPRPVKVGPLCPRGAACDEDRELLDYVSLRYGPEGRLHYAFARSSTANGGDLSARVAFAAETAPDPLTDADGGDPAPGVPALPGPLG